MGLVSKRAGQLAESITIAITTLAGELKREGRDIISFSAGEPDFDTPQLIKDEAISAINSGFTKYTAVEGIPELKKAVAEKLKRENGLNYEPKHIIVSNGAKHSIFNLFQAIIDDGDEVIIPSPYWVTYPELVIYSGGVVVEIKTDDSNSFKITPEQLQNAITPKTKLLVLTSPSNPTGAVYSKNELIALAEVLKDTNVFIASDEMYEKLVYDDKFVSTASISEDMYNRTITINGLSKSVAMTGWRFGYLATPHMELITAMKNLQSQSTSNINSITQKASIVGLSAQIEPEVIKMVKAFHERRDFAVKRINKINGLSVVKPAGAFYLFVNISKVSNNSMEFSQELLKNEGVAVVPGIGFGAEGYIRMSFATSMKNIENGLNRLERFVQSQNYSK
jgi:aspartate aminotransferase